MFIAIVSMITSVAFSQEFLSWSAVDTISKSKDILYSDAKNLIATNWKSSKSVIQLDDKENGQIMIKGVVKQNITSLGFTLPGNVYYNYTINFLFKDNKFKITLNNVGYESETLGRGWGNYLINTPQPEYPGAKVCGMQKKDYNKLIERLKNDLQGLFDLCVAELKKETKNDDW